MNRPVESPVVNGGTARLEHPQKVGVRSVRARKPYSPPTILVDGDVRGAVLGGSSGTGDSGGPGPLVTHP